MKETSLEEIQELLRQGEVVKVRNYVKAMGVAKDKASVDQLISILLTVTENSVRNAAAIAISDIDGSAAVGPIITLLRDNRTKGARGTLLYALAGLDISPYFDLLLDLILEENFEGSHQAFALVRDSGGPSNRSSISSIQERLEVDIQELGDKVHMLKELKKISKKWTSRDRSA